MAPAPGPQLTSSQPRPARRQRKPRSVCRRFQRKPPPLVIVNEPWGVGEWLALIVVMALVVAGLWLWGAGSEQRKWDRIEGAARAVERR
jgi:hypothetical protein